SFYAALEAWPHPIARDYLRLILFSGLRRSEAAALRWDEIDFAARTIRLPAQRTKSRTALHLPLTSYVRDLLGARRSIGNADGWVFPASHSVSGHITNELETLKTVGKTCDIDISIHDLRRTYITVAESCDISPLALKALVNHSLGNGITENYVRITVDR